MKKTFCLIALLALTLALFANTAYAGPIRTFNYGGLVKQEPAPSEPETPAIKLAPITHIGLPVNAISHRDSKTKEIFYTYEGEKKFTVDIKTPGVSLSASSDKRELEARARENYLFIESNSMKPGDTANVILIATHKSLPPATLEIKITITDGSAAYPHIISGKDDFLAIPSLGLNKRYVQTADFSLEEIRQWTAIGDAYTAFTGTYDGRGHKITNMEFREMDTEYPALFGVVRGKDARITGLNVEGKIDPLYYQAGSHGSIVGLLDSGTISDCSFKGDIVLRNSRIRAGGIVAEAANGAVVKNSEYTGKIKVETKNNVTYIGGIVGLLNGTVENCAYNGGITYEGANEPNVGGIAGLNKGMISGCTVKADISQYGAKSYIGGIAGYNYTTIRNCAYQGRLFLKGNEIWAGGITGGSVGSVTGCAVKGSLTYNGDDSYIGGAVGRNENAAISNISCEATITGQGVQCRAGGIAGENYSFISSANLNLKKQIIASVANCAFFGDITITGGGSYAGGIAGRNYGYTMISGAHSDAAKSVVEKCVSKTGALSASGGAKAARIAGDSLIETVGYKDAKVHLAVLSDNSAYSGSLVNGAEAKQGASADGINGAGFSEEELPGLLARYSIKPDGAELLK